VPSPLSATNYYSLWDTSLLFLLCHAFKSQGAKHLRTSTYIRAPQRDLPLRMVCATADVSLSVLSSRPIILWRWPTGQITAWCKPWWRWRNSVRPSWEHSEENLQSGKQKIQGERKCFLLHWEVSWWFWCLFVRSYLLYKNV